MMKPDIRKGMREDITLIAQYNVAMAHETENLTIELALLKKGVEAVINDDSHGYYLLAETEKVVVGCMMITYEWSDWRSGQFWWIQSVYVHPAHRRKGIFKALYEKVKTLAEKENTCVGLRLYVESENTQAKKTYEKLGMKKTHYHLYEKML